MKSKSTVTKFSFILLVTGLAVCASLISTAQSINPAVQAVSLPGSPFGVAVTPNGKHVFVSVQNVNGVAVIEQGHESATLLGVVPTGGSAWGMAITSDGKYLMVAVQGKVLGVQFIDVEKAIAGAPDAVLGTVPTAPGSDPVELALSQGDRFVFSANEHNGTVSVIDVRRALASGGDASSIVANIPVEIFPVGMTMSTNGHHLYIVNEVANLTHPGYDSSDCVLPLGDPLIPVLGTRNVGQGTIAVIDVLQAETDPANSVVASVFAGCSPVRVVVSQNSHVAWVTARTENSVLAFSTDKLLSDPSNALLSRTPVGTAPVGIQLFDNDRLIAVADSNRFVSGQNGFVSILDYGLALNGAGTSATVGFFQVDQFPREWGLSTNDHFLYLTEFSSKVLLIFPVPELIADLND